MLESMGTCFLRVSLYGNFSYRETIQDPEENVATSETNNFSIFAIVHMHQSKHL